MQNRKVTPHFETPSASPQRLEQPVASDFLVGITIRGRTKKIFWNPSHPLALDHPARHQLALHENEIVIEEILSGERISTVEESRPNSPFPANFGERSITVQRIVRPKAAYLSPTTHAQALAFIGVQDLPFIVSGSGTSISDFSELDGTIRPEVGGKAVFKLSFSRGTYTLTPAQNGMILEIRGKPARILSRKVAVAISAMELLHGTIRVNQYWWKITPVAPPRPDFLAALEQPEIDAESKRISQIIRTVTIAGIFISFALWLHPLPKEVNPSFVAHEVKVEHIELKKPKIIQVAPKPKPSPTPLPKPTPTPKPTPKPIEPKPPKKEMKKPKPIKPQPKRPLPKEAAVKPPPKPSAPPKATKPEPKKPVQVATKAAEIPVVAQKPQVKPVPVPPKPVITGPTPEQLKARAQAQLAKSLGFLSGVKSAASKTPAPFVNTATNTDTRYQNIESGAAQAGKKSKSVLSAMANSSGSGDGPISTKNARNVASDTGLAGSYGKGGKGKGLNEVQGKVALNNLYDPSGDMGSALGGASGMQMSGQGSINEGLILKLLQKYQERFNYCYEKALLSAPTIAGNLVMQWTIGPSGKATDIKVVRSQLNHPGLHSCMQHELGKIPFPSPQGGPVSIKFPFSFSSSAL